MSMNEQQKADLVKFQGLLRYFILHLEYWQYFNMNGKKGDGFGWPIGIGNYKDIITKGPRAGQGYNDGEIQNNISEWCSYNVGEICISVQSQYSHGYTTTASYLHWRGTGLNINAEWDEDKKQIDKLYFRDRDTSDVNEGACASRDDIFADEISDGVEKLYKDFFDAKKNALGYKKKESIRLLEGNYNLILTGAPGTGKTFLARDIAASMIGCDIKDINGHAQFCFVQFHPSYDYTDFVEGLRPDGNESKNEIKFKRVDGVFKEFCKKAAKCDNKKYVFVIDEINRGEISKIFGELFFSIDPGYRKPEDRIPVKTQYQKLITETDLKKEPFCNGFYVPENVYIIGTMNDIDRSVESMDFAFRRRFSFVEVTASESESIIYSQQEKVWMDNKKMETVKRMRRLNEAIVNPNIGNLSEQYQIGGAYFLKLSKNNFDFDKLWKENLHGVLFEYYRGNPDAKKIMKELENAYNLK